MLCKAPPSVAPWSILTWAISRSLRRLVPAPFLTVNVLTVLRLLKPELKRMAILIRCMTHV